MTDTSGSFLALPLSRAIAASLRLANKSVNSLSTPQLSTMQSKLRETLGIFDDKLRERGMLVTGELIWTVQHG